MEDTDALLQPILQSILIHIWVGVAFFKVEFCTVLIADNVEPKVLNLGPDVEEVSYFVNRKLSDHFPQEEVPVEPGLRGRGWRTFLNRYPLSHQLFVVHGGVKLMYSSRTSPLARRRFRWSDVGKNHCKPNGKVANPDAGLNNRSIHRTGVVEGGDISLKETLG